jgi:membrane protease subunit (stomatin/prohibitin family)
MAAAHLVGAQAQAMQDAANNQNGAMGAFMGMGMAQNAGGNAASLFQMGQQQAQQAAQQPAPAPAAPAAPAAGAWTCPKCGAQANGKFCMECGEKKPASADGWTCPGCGKVNKGKFCPECGEKKPEGAPTYKCDKCGWEPEDPHHPPKFCPECGDIFDDKDKK